MRAAILIAGLLIGACGAAPKKATLVLFVDVADAELVVDDRAQITAGNLDRGVPIIMRAGFHRLELSREGYHRRYVEVTLAPGERRELRVRLAEKLP